jgi:hypothetical protein
MCLRRPGSLREIANAALFLASDESSFIAEHAALVVDGGLTAQLQDAAAARVEEALLRDGQHARPTAELPEIKAR